MRTIVDIPDEQLKRLDRLAAKQKLSRAEAVRRAVSQYLEDAEALEQAFKSAFGAWKHKGITDSVEYVRNLREEWER